MKQTKPYGRAFTPTMDAKKGNEAEKVPQKSQKSSSQPSVELFDLSGSKIDDVEQEESHPIQKKLRTIGIFLGITSILLGVYVGMRDSMILGELLDVTPNVETIMVCKDGKMFYKDEYSLLDRILNNGNFICTDWHVRSGFLTIPRKQ